MELGQDEKLHKGSQKIEIKDYTKLKGSGIGTMIKIYYFTFGGHGWMIYFYPNGVTVDDREFVSFFIDMIDDRKKQVKALIELKLVDQSGKGNDVSFKNSTSFSMKGRGTSWGFKRFYKRANLENSDFLKDDSLVIFVTIGIVVSKISNSWRVYVPESDMGRYIGKLLNNRLGCDVVFNVAGENFHAHKVVLAACSPYFRDQFFKANKADMVEEGEIVVIKDMKPEVFKAMLHFIYTGTLLEDGMLVEFISSSEIYDETLLGEAELHGLEGFKLKFYSYLWANISANNAAKIFTFANRHDDAMELKSACLSFLVENLAAVVQSNGLKCLKEDFSLLHSEIFQMVPGAEEKYSRGEKIRNSWTRLSDFRYDLGVLLEDPVGCDVVFNVAGKKFDAHKVVLAARSPVFQDQFFENGQAKAMDESEIGVSNVEPEVFKAMLHFIYRDSLLVDNELNRPTASSSKSSALDTFVAKLFVAAYRYRLTRLACMCQSHLCKDLSVISVGETHALAVSHGATDLKFACLHFALENLTAILRVNGLNYLKANFPSLLFDVRMEECERELAMMYTKGG
ncbi:hypothetical protein AQUCO_00201212v1 [Aquilegia coerulea]|uniref:BTB domain-containing protein n=1 Tax=Aquilegia coerulea TaxID=218851 RepID=A0A2G5F6T0_AQUCA|nr:hypothetical protein AQUCO_00201212v1 [Aquilegia coerulea]